MLLAEDPSAICNVQDLEMGSYVGHGEKGGYAEAKAAKGQKLYACAAEYTDAWELKGKEDRLFLQLDTSTLDWGTACVLCPWRTLIVLANLAWLSRGRSALRELEF